MVLTQHGSFRKILSISFKFVDGINSRYLGTIVNFLKKLIDIYRAGKAEQNQKNSTLLAK